MTASFLDLQWPSAVAWLLGAINATSGHRDYLRPKTTLAANDLAKIGDELARRNYRPDEWFQPGRAIGTQPIGNKTPPIDPKADYRLLGLTALRQTASRLSTRFGGVVFEDPFYALLACFNIGTYRKLLILPKVTDVDQAWQQRSAIVSSISNGVYKPDELFLECMPVGEDRTGLPMTSLSVRGDLLQQLREVGEGNIHDGVGFSRYALYEFVEHK